MSEEQQRTIWRFALIFALIMLGFAAVLARIIYIQTVERDGWMEIARKQEPVVVGVRANRGNIIDAKGRILASSMPQFYAYMDTRVPALHAGGDTLFYHNVDSLAACLSRTVGERTSAEYRAYIIGGFRRGEGRLRLTGLINYVQRRELEEMKLLRLGRVRSGIFFEQQHKRIKPFGNLASRTIGSIYGEDGYGNSGLEKRYDEQLRGDSGLCSIQRIAGRKERITIKEATDGMDIITTIDADLQDIVEQNLLLTLNDRSAKWGCCILMETATGHVKAIANLDRTSDGQYCEQLNHAVKRVEPGSTFKTIALMAALDDGKIDLDDTVSVTRRPWEYFGVKHTDAHPRDTVYDVRSALACSSNIALAKYITRSYEGSAKKFVRRIEKMGLCDSIYSEIPGAENARIDIPKDTVTLSKMAYGYSVELSPMQILMFYNAIANNGRMVRPMLVSAIRQDGHDTETFDTEVVQSSICSRSTLRDIRLCLHDVVWDNHLGTAALTPWGRPKAQSPLVAIAGKTGTAQLFIPGHGYSGRHHRMTFVGYFPEDNPQYTCICMVEDPVAPYDAGMDCGAAVRRIAEKTMAYTGCYIYDKKGNQLLVSNNH